VRRGYPLTSAVLSVLDSIRTESLLRIVGWGLVAVLVVSIVFLSCVPPVSKDALTHHLAVPNLYLKHGGIYEIPSMVVSYYPMNLDLLYLIPLYFGNDIVPKFIHFSFALLTSWLIFSYLKRRINTTYALLGVIFFLSVPIIVKLSITVYVDLGLIFFSTISLLLLLRWVEEGFGLRSLMVSALFCGLAAGTKYNGLITLFLLTLFTPFLYSRYAGKHSPYKAAGYGILFLFVALLTFSPWMIRNYVWTNNPMCPLYDHWFNPQNAMNRQTISHFAFRSLVYHETWWQIALLPVRVFFEGRDGNPQYFDGKLNPFLVLLPFLAFYNARGDPEVLRGEKKTLLAFAGLFFAFAFFGSSMRIRYVSPIIPPLTLLSIFGIRNMANVVSGLSGRYSRNTGFATVFLIISLPLCLNAWYIRDQYKYVDPLSYLSGSLGRDEYIAKFRPEYPAIRYINDNLPYDARILFIYLGNRGYYCDREYIFDTYRNRSAFRQLVKASSDPEAIYLGLKGMEITHLLIRYDIFDKWVKTDFTARDREVMKAFFKEYVKFVFFKWGYGVSVIREPI
jgi:hypothetical protein